MPTQTFLSVTTIPSWSRFKKLATRKTTLFRALQDEVYATLSIDGRWIDIGGAKKSSYLPLMTVRGTLDTLNFSDDLQPTFKADLNNPLPIASDTYDGALCFNTLEHIENDQAALKEINRIIKPGGTIHIVVPFLYPYHADPDDFNRHTSSQWANRMTAAGFSTFAIQPLVWDPVSSAASILDAAVPRLRPIVRAVSLLPGLVFALIKKRPGQWAPVAVGYYISGCK